MKVLISTLTWLAVVQGFVLINYQIIEKDKRIPLHGLHFWIAVLWALALSAVIYKEQGVMICVNVLYLGLMQWIIFPLELNYFRHKPLLYLGTDSKLDRIEAKFKNPGGTLMLKIVLLVMCLFFLLDLPTTYN